MVFVLSTQPQGPTTESFARAAQDVLGEDSSLVIQPVEEARLDLGQVAEDTGADGVVELAFREDGTGVTIHSYARDGQRLTQREVTFSEQDLQEERGRLLGYLVGSMFADEVEKPPPEPPPPAPAPLRVVIQDVPPPSRQAPRLPNLVELSGVLAVDPTGEAGGVGASAAGLLRLWRRLFLRASVAGRVGEIPTAYADSSTLNLGLGLGLHVWGDGGEGPEMHLRSEALATWIRVTHQSPDDATVVEQHRALGGGATVATLGYRFSPEVGVFAGAGVEVMAGRTDISVEGVRVASLDPLRFLTELGFRVAF